jgi:two-component system, OmpR family, phosphate regulon sensor histidine kinase PhoR
VGHNGETLGHLSESDRDWLGILGTLAGGALMRATLVAERAASEARLETLFESAACGLLAIDAKGRIIQANPMAEDILGCTPGQLRGCPVTNVVEAAQGDGSPLPEGEHPAMAALRGSQAISGVTLRISRPDGQMRWLQMEAAPVLTLDETLVQVVVSFVDVTERKVAEEQRLELASDQAARVQAQAAVRARDEFLSVAAHELKTPIASLRLAAQLLIRSLETEPSPQPEKLRKLSETVADQSNKISRLIEQLLDISRLEAGKLGFDRYLTDVARLVEGVALTARAHTDKHTIVVHAPLAPVRAQVDALRIEQVLWNLVDNAIKYSPFGGVIDLAVRQPTSNEVRLELRDRGLGIPYDKVPRVFERFYQAHDGGQVKSLAGLGLGLYISREIVELHGGEITVESPPDGGTRLIVRLPTGLGLPPAAPLVSRRNSEQAPPHPGR